ncbi:lysophospholipid acyltransferase family protein [Yinghuangia sp. ASG 101]|uniref:lysophospholipid acyltransferase family protein n=1 Tax=Yinghuangia sp. ASG 101 TaxID=2896848 RepID=UPI0022B237A3|nr:lysophospholipid acyltransferase family protein [Yinghuangia sp. ASG 101]
MRPASPSTGAARAAPDAPAAVPGGDVPPARRSGAAGVSATAAPGSAHPGPATGWVPNAPCTPGNCIPPVRRPVRAPRRIARCVACAAVLLVGAVSSPVVARMRPSARDRLIRAWVRAAARAIGVRVHVSGDVPGEPARKRATGDLFVANHVSWLDVAVLAAVRPARTVAKREVGAWPVLGRWVRRGGTLFVTRDRPRALPGDVAVIAAALRSGSAVAVFPEGSSWCGARHGPFRRAVFQAALDAGAVVRPVAISYHHTGGTPARTAAFVGDDTFGTSIWRVAGERGLVARARVLPAIAPGTHADRRTLAAAAEEAVTRARG